MIPRELTSAVGELYHLQNCELAMGEYYQCLADRFEDDRMFWQEAISDEVNHARAIGRIIAMVSMTPKVFRPGKFRVAVLDTFLNGVYTQIEQVQKNALTEPEMLKIAFDYECAPILTRPYDIIDSNDEKFVEFKRKFAAEVAEHSERIRQFISQKNGISEKTQRIKIQPGI